MTQQKGKCTHCGTPMEQESNENWNVYCSKPECMKAFQKEVVDIQVNGIKTSHPNSKYE